jgi:hypothetical protein
MCGEAPEISVVAMTITPRTHRLILALAVSVAAALCVAALWPSAGGLAGRTKTLKVFSQMQSMTLTHADGTVITHPPFPEVVPGDVLDVYSLDFRGTHKKHSKRFIGTDHLQCMFGTGEPDCVSHVALGSSMLIFEGNPGTLVAGLGRFQGATGQVTSSKEVPGGTDVVAKIKLAKRHP